MQEEMEFTPEALQQMKPPEQAMSYQPLDFELKDAILRLMRLLFAKKRTKESRNYAEKALEETI